MPRKRTNKVGRVKRSIDCFLFYQTFLPVSPVPSLHVVKVFGDKQSRFSWWSIFLHCSVCARMTANCWWNGIEISTGIKKKIKRLFNCYTVQDIVLYLRMAPSSPWMNWQGPTTKRKDPGFLWLLNLWHVRPFLVWSQPNLTTFQMHLPLPYNPTKWFFLLTSCHLFLSLCVINSVQNAHLSFSSSHSAQMAPLLEDFSCRLRW